MDKQLDDRCRLARARVHDTARDLHEAHASFLSASERFEKALAAYTAANDALIADDQAALARVADANELAKASDSERRLKAQKEL